VRQQVLAGVDQIKVYSDLEKDVYLAIIAEALLHGLKPVGHVPEAVYIEEAARVGQCTCEHLFGFEKMIAKLLGEEVRIQKGGMGAHIHYWLRMSEVDRELLSQKLIKIKETGMVICPTLVVFFGHARAKEIFSGTFPFLETVSPQIRNIWSMFWNPTESEIDLYQKISRHMQAFVYELYKAGVPLLIGTDLTTFGIIPGYSLHEEMKLWQDAGIPPVDVLRSATLTPARFFNMESDLGSIEPGKMASMVLVRGNPLEDISHACDIAEVFLRGEPVYTTK
jgi:imidazolonepropionase-like amidohydrolase